MLERFDYISQNIEILNDMADTIDAEESSFDLWPKCKENFMKIENNIMSYNMAYLTEDSYSRYNSRSAANCQDPKSWPSNVNTKLKTFAKKLKKSLHTRLLTNEDDFSLSRYVNNLRNIVN